MLKHIINKKLYLTAIKRFYSNNKVLVNLRDYQTNNLSFVEDLLKSIAGIFSAPFGFTTVETNHVKLLFRFGKYDGYITEGLKWRVPIGYSQQIFCGDKTLNFDNLNLTDLNGNPMNISSFVVYNVINPINYVINVEKEQILINYIESMFRQYLTKFTYNELTSTKYSLNDFIQEVNKNEKSLLYGIEIQTSGILQINYAKEIAETMLVKQKVNATIDARKEIIEQTLTMVHEISEKLGDKLTKEDKSKLVTCLTISLIGSSSPTNVINLN